MAKTWNQWKQHLFTAALVSVAMWAGAQQPEQVPLDIPGEGTVEQPLGSVYTAPKKTGAKVARITFYRPATDTHPGVVHVDVSGHHHTSLQRAAFAEICIDPRELSLTAHVVDANQDSASSQSSLSFKPRAANNFYVRLQDSGARTPVITLVADKVAHKELQSTRRQIHIATRVADATECVEPATNPAHVDAPAHVNTAKRSAQNTN